MAPPYLDVHVDGGLGVVGGEEEALGLGEVARLGVVLRNDGRVLGRGGRVEDVDDAGGLGPLPRGNGRLDGLARAPRLDVVVDGCVELLLPRQVVAPRLLEGHHLRGKGRAAQLQRLPERVALPVRLERPLRQAALQPSGCVWG